jgi:hypothetical protein
MEVPMNQDALIMLLIGIAVTSALFALGIIVYPKLKSEKQGYPFEAAIEAALLPLIFKGVCAAYRLSEQGVDDIQLRIKGVDKKKIADTVYRMMPENIGPFEITLVKRVITQERFKSLVQNVFDNFDTFFVEHQKHFDDLFETWKAENLREEQAQHQAVHSLN